jgi:hypothetical protein
VRSCRASSRLVAPLPQPLTIPDVLTLETLADVRALVENHLPPEYRRKLSWRQFAGLVRRRQHRQAAFGRDEARQIAANIAELRKPARAIKLR